jgi:hypothetical protein
MFAIKTELLKAALADRETCERIEKADTWSEITRILEGFAKRQGFKVVNV